jgi:hypothetical protein
MRTAFTSQRPVLLEGLARAGMSGSVVWFFRGEPGEDVRRLKLDSVSTEIARLCRRVVEKL